jgi:DNA-binding winged helix-turn-helix (wHTH) protein
VSPEIRAFGKFAFHPATGELFSGDERVELQNQPARVLEILTRRPGELVTREEIRRALWGGETFVDFDRNLNYCIRRIRAALGDSPRTPRYVETLPRRGYRFLAPVAVGRDRAPRKRLDLAAAAFVLGLLGGAVMNDVYASSSLHRRVVDWLHDRLEVAGESCPWAHSAS